MSIYYTVRKDGVLLSRGKVAHGTKVKLDGYEINFEGVGD